MKWFLKLTGLAIVLLIAFVLVQINHRPIFQLPEPPNKKGSVDMVFAGTSTMLFTDGQVQWCIDCFLSRPSMAEVMFTSIEPNREKVEQTAKAMFQALNRPEKLESVLVAHSHYDHSMDAALVVELFGGRVAGSESTRQIAIGHGLKDDQFDGLKNGDVLTIGRFKVQAIESRHAPTGFTGGENTLPLVPPAHALEYKEGLTYAFAVWHESTGDQEALFVIQASAGYQPGQFEGIKTNHLFLSPAGLGRLEAEDIEAYWTETVTETGAKNVYLIHWDDFTQPIYDEKKVIDLVPMPYLLDDLGTSLSIMNSLAKNEGVNLYLLQSFTRVAIQ